jgi:hypothetical protein
MPDLSISRRFPLGRPSGATAPPSAPQAQGASGAGRARPAWLPAWSVPAGLRTLRVVIVIPSLFALTYEGFGNLQMALFAAFGGFASLIFAAFGGTRRDKVMAHFMLALIGSIGLIIGTAVNGITWLAVLVSIPVAFGIFLAGLGRRDGGRAAALAAVTGRPAPRGGGRLGPRAGRPSGGGRARYRYRR